MTRKILFILAAFLITIFPAAAQNIIKGVVTDADTKIPVVGAVVSLSSSTSPDDKLYFSSDLDGNFATTRLKNGVYSLVISFFGYEDYTQKLTVSNAPIILPEVKLSMSTNQIEAVVKEVKALRASQEGDTLNYNAASFKVAADADVESLVQKMPGITIEDGTISAQGEEVTKIFVDGREFFGSDVATALKSLPAEVVAGIEVYDKLSDNAELSGVDDGESSKAINIVTHKSMRRGVFGKLYGGYAYEPNPADGVDPSKYLVGGNLNYFNEARRVSAIFLFNNLNQTNFSFEDIMGTSDESSESSDFMVKNQPGVSVVNAVGINYSDVFGEKDKLKVQASYFYNSTDTYNEKSTIKWFDDPANVNDSETISDTRNLNHRLNGRVDWKINESQSLMIRPSLSFQNNDPFSTTTGEKTGESYTNYQDYERTMDGVSDSYWQGFNVSTSVNYRAKLDQKGRLITFSGYYSLNDYMNDNDWQDYTYSYSTEDGEYVPLARYQHKDATSLTRKLKGDLMYMEPLSKKFSLSFNYKYENEYQESDNTTYYTTSDYVIESVNDDATSLSDSKFDEHKVGLGFRYAKDKTNVILKVYYEDSKLSSNIVNSDGSDSPSRRFQNVTYFSMANINFNKENSMKFRINSYVSNPTIWKLQNIYNIGTNISKGNPNLDPSYTNKLRVQYNHSNLDKGRSFMYMAHIQNTINSIGNHIVYEPGEIDINGETQSYDQYTTYANIDGMQWYLFTRFSYGLPVDFLKSNLNLGASVSYNLNPAYVGGTVQSDGTIDGGTLTDSDNLGYSIYATLGSNISDRVDFTFKWSGRYNIATNASTEITTRNEYWSQEASANMKFVLPLDFTITASAAYNQYEGITDDYDEQSLVCNLFLGKKVFKNKRGEVLAGVCDLLNQNTSFSRSTGTNYTQNQTNSVIGRYFTLQFIYNLRYFGKNSSSNLNVNDFKVSKDDDRRGPH